MDAPKAAVRLSAVVAVAAAGLLLALSVLEPGAQALVPVTTRDGAPFEVPAAQGVYPAQWRETPVLVFVVPQERLDGVEALRGEGSATPAVAGPGGLAVFVLSAKSTDLGCTVGFNTGLPASKDIADYDGDGRNDGRVLDPCHHAQWDAYRRGEPVPGTPADGPSGGRLAALRLTVDGDGLSARGFDGPVGSGV